MRRWIIGWLHGLVTIGVSAVLTVAALANDEPRWKIFGEHWLWGVGRWDGRPADENAEWVESEFGRLRAPDDVVTIRRREDFPQVIEPGQSLVVRLNDLPRTSLALRIALVSAVPDPGHPEPVDDTERRLRVVFNGRVIWRRWVAAGHTLVEAFVPPSRVEDTTNLLVIENEGEHPAAFDAVWLERYQPGAPLRAAVTGMEQKEGRVAADAGRTVLRLALPTETGTLNSKAPPHPPRQVQEAVSAYLERFQAPGTRRDSWQEAILEALRRGLLPWAEIQPVVAEKEAWEYVASRYGGMIEGWIVHGAPAAERLLEVYPDARVYAKHAPGLESTGEVLMRESAAFGGRVDRLAGDYRKRRHRAGREPGPLPMLWAYAPISLGDIVKQRRSGQLAAETLVQWWMAGGDSVVLEGDAGSDFFPDIHGQPSPAWEAVRYLFGAVSGSARRSLCSVTPEGDGAALARGSWVMIENGPELVTFLYSGVRGDAPCRASLSFPVPWQGPTEGRVEGLTFPDRRTGDPVPIPGYSVDLQAREDPSTDRGFLRLSAELAGIRRIRLWPSGRPPPPPPEQITALPARPPRPASLRGVFQVHPGGDPPPEYRYEELRRAEWPAGPLGGGHVAEVRTATHDTFFSTIPRHRLGLTESASVRNTAPWEKDSLFVTLHPGAPPHGFRFWWNGEAARTAHAMMVYVRVHTPTASRPVLGSLPPPPVRLWVGTLSRRQRLDLEPNRWHRVLAPRDPLFHDRDPAWAFHVWPDEGETRILEYEFNGFAALHTRTRGGRDQRHARAAVRESDDGSRLQIMIEGPELAPVVQQWRMEHPLRIVSAEVIQPDGFEDVRIIHREAAQIIELFVPAMPAALSGIPSYTAERLFPRVRPNPDPSVTRILLQLDIER